MVTIRRLERADIPGMVAVIHTLPDYFTPDVPDEVDHHAREHGGWVAFEADELVGLVVAERRSGRVAEILWAAVRSDVRGNGVGRALVETAMTAFAEDGVDLVEVKTLDASAGYEPYVATRAFWAARGFVQVDTIDPLPGWPPGNPAAIYVASFRPTAPSPSLDP